MTPSLQVHPDRESFDRLAAEWPLVPVWAEVLADVGTPVGLFPAIAGDGPGVLFESVERSERWGRYSFVAGDPAAVLIADDAGVHLRDVARDLPTGEPSRRLTPREALRAVVNGLRAPRPDGLPPISGGLMGCVSYEAATLLDGHPTPHPADAPVPPIALLVIDRAVVFDHWRQRLVLVVHAQRDGYDHAVGSLEELAAKVASAPSLPLLAASEGAPTPGDTNMKD
jgi:anthranilate synthase component 1